VTQDSSSGEREIARAHYAYAYALDTRDWAQLDSVFDESAQAHYGPGIDLNGREAIVRSIRTFLDHCGPTQHLIGNLDIDIQGERANARCYIRAHHLEKDSASPKSYEAFGRYESVWVRGSAGWRVTDWTMTVTHEVGSREVLGLRAAEA
jgi:3-phenylpropionate/cinnamic acid dioxygenase small subunit